MGCGGSRASAIEPRCHGSWTRETETTWLPNTDVEAPQGGIASPEGDAGDGDSAAGTAEGGRLLSSSAPHRPKQMVNACTQCGKERRGSASGSRTSLREQGDQVSTETTSKEGAGSLVTAAP
ncbi:brain and acute leukemia cytoplasmic protein-like [Scleropages formosus]|uniref:brain and acute leukemia cytoplasmic protein-like n=1 Tax=Scleropages formosus TaxID=113540 RepID=UPI0010FAA513|nr:brain and acute leukemia cytoplasmic protein-like [Scleropages formosus]